MMANIPSSQIGVQINEWYIHIKRFNVTDAEILKTEIERNLNDMEEDQDVLLYFQLMEFRHRLMLDYLNPSENRMNKADYLREVEGQGKRLTGLLEYYFHFFKGMYEFSKGEYLRAITFYRRAEKKLSQVSDEIERAEFYYKISEVFYHMKQTHMSMYYVKLAYDTYTANSTYVIREINCLTVVAGNYIDLKTHEKALVHFENTLKIARSLDNDSMVTKALLNVGCCHNDMGQYDKAVSFFHSAVEVGEKIKAKELIQAYYDLALIYLRKGNRETGVSFFEKSLEYVQFFEDALFGRVLNVLKALYIDLGDREHVLYAMNELRNAAGFPYLEELALEAAEFYNRLERLDDSVYFYRQMIDAQKQIRRGDGLYEF